MFEQNGQRRKKTNFRSGRKLGHDDHFIELTKLKVRPDWMSEQEYCEAPISLLTRELRTGKKLLTTTLMCAEEMPKSAVKALYKERWNVEQDFRNLKTTLGMDMLRCKTPEMVRT